MNRLAAAPAAPAKTTDEPTIWRVDDALWAELQPLLVVDKPRKRPGRPRNDARPIFDGLIWLARRGGQWAALPREFGAKSTVHDRFLAWVEHGCFALAWARLLEVYDDEVGLDWQWQAADGCIVKAPLGNKGGPARRRRRGAPRPTGASAAPSGTCGPRGGACPSRSASPGPTATT
jgi:transposase